jgi:hypothetical protein
MLIVSPEIKPIRSCLVSTPPSIFRKQATRCDQLSIMSTDKNDTGDLDDLLSQLCRAAGNFKKHHNDLERTTALRAARKLVHTLEKPQDAALLTGLSVRVF